MRFLSLVGGSTTESYSYDAVGNRLSSLGVPTYNYNSSNELTSNSTGSDSYDHNGNTLTDAQGRSFMWDFENRLVQAVVPGQNGGTTTFKYDPFGRRIQKAGPLGTTNYLYEGTNLIEEVDYSASVVARYTQGTEIDEPLSWLRSGTASYYQQDDLGSVTSLTSSFASLASTYAYDSFGNLGGSTGTVANPFQYTGREYDPESGLRYYRARYYDPTTGRFVSEDPIGFAGSGPNLYGYVFDNPANLIDPFGLEPGDWWDPRSYDFSHYDPWDTAKDVGTAAEAFTDSITFGSASRLNDALGAGQMVDRCGIGHKLGSASGIVASVAIGGAMGAKAAEANAGKKGFEFSHWIPNRAGGPRSIYNGNYVSQKLHYLTDPFRYPSGWQAFGPKLPSAAQQLLRIPWVYGGAAAGAASGGTGSAMSGKNCGCKR